MKENGEIINSVYEEIATSNRMVLNQFNELYDQEQPHAAVNFLMNADVAILRRNSAGTLCMSRVPLVDRVRTYVASRAPSYWVDDVTSDVLLKIVGAVHKGKIPTTSLTSWMYAIVRNRMYEIYKSERKFMTNVGVNVGSDIGDLIDIVNTNGGQEPMLDVVTALDNADLIKFCLSCLKENQKELIQLYYFGQLSLQEIAEREEITVEVLKSRLYRIRMKMKNYAYNEVGIDSLW